MFEIIREIKNIKKHIFLLKKTYAVVWNPRIAIKFSESGF